jgi:hypothetical protein
LVLTYSVDRALALTAGRERVALERIDVNEQEERDPHRQAKEAEALTIPSTSGHVDND